MTDKTLINNDSEIANDDKNLSSHPALSFNSEICNLKHGMIEKEFQSINKQSELKHAEIIDIITNLRQGIKEDNQEAYDNLKDKIVLVKRTLGDKIDKLDEFDESLRGNGNPGIKESIRMLTWRVKVVFGLTCIIILLMLGGEFRGITLDKIKNIINGTKNTQIEKEPQIPIKTDKKYIIIEDHNKVDNDLFSNTPDINQ
jgi:hypothetical protein